MNTNWSISKISAIFFVVFALFSTTIRAQEVGTNSVVEKIGESVDDTDSTPVVKKITEIADEIEGKEYVNPRYVRRIEKYNSRWNKLIPSYTKMQLYGGMGLISIGTGWSYGKNKQWETDIFFGFIPKYSSRKNKMTFTLKQNFIPWSIRLNDSFNFKPMATGLYINTVFGGDFWYSEPGKYPNNYYTFSSKMRFNIFLGQGIEFKINPKRRIFTKSITAFYEVSTNDLYLISAITNRYLKAKDFLVLSVGLKLQIL